MEGLKSPGGAVGAGNKMPRKGHQDIRLRVKVVKPILLWINYLGPAEELAATLTTR